MKKNSLKALPSPWLWSLCGLLGVGTYIANSLPNDYKVT